MRRGLLLVLVGLAVDLLAVPIDSEIGRLLPLAIGSSIALVGLLVMARDLDLG